MSAANDISVIESGIMELRQKLTTLRSRKLTFERSVAKLVELTSLARASNVYHATNLRHMKNVAEVVDIQEFAQVREHESNSAASLEMGVKDLNAAAGGADACTAAIADAESELARQIQRLESFGTVIPFKSAS